MSDATATATAAPATEAAPDVEDQMAAELATLRQARVLDAPEPAALGDALVAGAGLASDTGVSPAGAATQGSGATAATAAAAAVAADPADVLRQTQAQLQHARSELGRVGALNRNLTEARAQLSRLVQENASLKRAAPSPEQKLSDDAAGKLAALSDKVKGFPELEGLVGAVQEALLAVDAKAATVAEQTAARAVAPLQGLRAEHAQREQEQRTAAYEAAMQTFQSTYPNAVEVVRSADFSAWIQSQPRPTQQAFHSGQTPDEAMVVMDAYDAHLRRAGRAPIGQYPGSHQQQQQPAAHRASANAARLQSAAGLPSRAGGARGGLPPEDDFEASLDFFRRQRLGQR